MQFSILVLLQALAVSAASTTVPVESQDRCQALYRQCTSAGTPVVACQCDLAICTGEDNERNRVFCANATATIIRSTASATSGSSTLIVGTPGSQPSGQPPITAPEGSLALGATCSDTKQCAGGAQCYGTTAGTIRTCGSFNAACSSDLQCATNTCNNGICSGPKATTLSSVSRTSSSSPPTTITGTAGSQPSGQPPVTAAEGSLALGEICSDSHQCANRVECWGSNAGIIRRCGNFNASCEKDEQCAYDLTCNNGLCNGLPKSAWSTTTAAPIPVTSAQACFRKVVTVTVYE